MATLDPALGLHKIVKARQLLDHSKDTLHTRIARYVAVRRERGEQMKAIVPEAAKRFKVSQSTVRAVYMARHGPGGALRA
jgi:hypothetical protein